MSKYIKDNCKKILEEPDPPAGGDGDDIKDTQNKSVPKDMNDIKDMNDLEVYYLCGNVKKYRDWIGNIVNSYPITDARYYELVELLLEAQYLSKCFLNKDAVKSVPDVKHYFVLNDYINIMKENKANYDSLNYFKDIANTKGYSLKEVYNTYLKEVGYFVFNCLKEQYKECF